MYIYGSITVLLCNIYHFCILAGNKQCLITITVIAVASAVAMNAVVICIPEVQNALVSVSVCIVSHRMYVMGK